MEEVMLAGYPHSLARVLIKLSSLPFYHTQRINTSFHLVTTNHQFPDSEDFVARKFECKVTRPFSCLNRKEKVVWLRETIAWYDQTLYHAGHLLLKVQVPMHRHSSYFGVLAHAVVLTS